MTVKITDVKFHKNLCSGNGRRTDGQTDVTRLKCKKQPNCESTDRAERCTVSVRVTSAMTVARILVKVGPPPTQVLPKQHRGWQKATGCDAGQLCVSCNMSDSATTKRLLHSRLGTQRVLQ